MCRRVCCFVPAFVFGLALAAEAPAPLREAEFLAPLATGHPALEALTGELAVARAARERSGLFADPILSADREDVGDTHETAAALHWEPPLPGRRRLAIAAGDAAVSKAEARLVAARLEVRSRARAAFAAWAVASERRAALERQLVVLRRLDAAFEARTAVGESSGLARRRVALVVAQAVAEIAVATAGDARAAATAQAWLPASHAPPSWPELPALPELAGPPDLELHPTLRALAAELEEANHDERLARSWLPIPSLSAGWKQVEERRERAEGIVLGLAWRIPVFDRNQPARHETAAVRRALEAAFRDAEVRTRATLEGALAAYEHLRLAALAAKDTSAGANEIVTAAEAATRLGEADLTDLLDALRSTFGAEQTALELYEAALVAQRELELAAGRPLFVQTTGNHSWTEVSP